MEPWLQLVIVCIVALLVMTFILPHSSKGVVKTDNGYFVPDGLKIIFHEPATKLSHTFRVDGDKVYFNSAFHHEEHTVGTEVIEIPIGLFTSVGIVKTKDGMIFKPSGPLMLF